MTTGVACPPIILQFTYNNGQLAAGGSVLTQVGGVNAATYQDVGLTTPLPNPIPLNSRGEISNASGASCQLFLTPNTVYTFTLFDANGNQINVASYVNGVQLTITQSVVGAALWPQTAAESTASITPTNLQYAPYQVQRYMSVGQLTDYLAGTAAVDQTSAFVTANTVAYAGGAGKIYAPNGIYRIVTGFTLTSGVTLIGDGSGGSEYYPSSPWNTVQVTQFWKKSTDTTGPIIIIQTANQVKGLYLRHDVIGGMPTGIIQVGTASHAVLTDGTYNAEFEDISLYGAAILGSNAALQDCTGCGLYFYDASVANTVQRYGNRGRGIRIQNVYAGIRLGNNCNANSFANLTMRQVYQPLILNGGSDASCVDNAFTGMQFFVAGQNPQVPITFTAPPTGTGATLSANWTLQSGVVMVLFSDDEIRPVTFANGTATASWPVALTGTPTVSANAGLTLNFDLQNGAVSNTFSGYATECEGAPFYIDASSAAAPGNNWLGSDNEPYAPVSVVPPGSFHPLWAQPNNRSQTQNMLVPNASTPLGYTNGQGMLVRQAVSVGGTLPQLGGSTTLVAGNTNCATFARFNATVYAKGAKPSFKAKLAVFLCAPGGGVGEALTEVEFWYRVTNNTTNAGSFSVISVTQQPSSSNYISGLFFLTGVASGLGMGLAITGGNLGSSTAVHLIADLEILAITFSTNSVPMSDYAAITWNCVAVTANDVTDAITLLTTGSTAV